MDKSAEMLRAKTVKSGGKGAEMLRAVLPTEVKRIGCSQLDSHLILVLIIEWTL